MASPTTARLVAVYESEREAQDAVDALQRAGVTRHDLRIADARDHVAAVRGEMRSEMNSSWPSHVTLGPTREMTEGSLVGALVGGVIGAVLALPFAALFGGVVWWARVIIVLVVGISVGATLGWVVGGGFGAKRPDEPLAAESGVTVAVPASEAVRQVLHQTHPRRIDLIEADDRPVSTMEEDRRGHILRDMGRNMATEKRNEG
jgi:hypothetical protein